jgi:lipoyl(octanoyl) transferase
MPSGSSPADRELRAGRKPGDRPLCPPGAEGELVFAGPAGRLGTEWSVPKFSQAGFQDLGLMRYADALKKQRELVELRKSGGIADQLVITEHPHVITMGRNGHASNLLASPEVLKRAGIGFFETDRGGDVTYHGPGQVVGYPILDLREWKRDVHAYVRALEQVIIDTLGGFGIAAGREPGATGVWTGEGKIAAIGVHISRWVTSHGFALNVDTDLNYFQYIVPCGLTRPVTSMRNLGSRAERGEVVAALIQNFGSVFERQMENL